MFRNHLLSNGDGTFGSLTQIDDVGSHAHGAAIGDFDGDGNLNFIAGNGDGGTISPFFYKGNGDGAFQPRVAISLFQQ
jgi:hypothetical protein